MFVEMKPALLRHLDAFRALPKNRPDARQQQATVLVEKLVDEIDAARKQPNGGNLVTITARAEFFLDNRNGKLDTKDVEKKLRSYRPIKGNRVVDDVTATRTYLGNVPVVRVQLITTNSAPEQKLQDAKDWLQGKSLGNGQYRTGWIARCKFQLIGEILATAL